MKLVIQWLVILLLALSKPTETNIEVLLKKALPSIESETFAKTFYLNSRFSHLSLNSSENKAIGDVNSNLSLDVFVFSSESQNVSSSLCDFHLQNIIKRLQTNQRDASLLTFLDSFAKPVPGVMNGNLNCVREKWVPMNSFFSLC